MITQFMASVLSHYVKFDASNAEHRRLAAEYLQTRSWKHTQTRFIIQFPFTNVVTMLTTKIALYYTSKEFTDLYENAPEDEKHGTSRVATMHFEVEVPQETVLSA